MARRPGRGFITAVTALVAPLSCTVLAEGVQTLGTIDVVGSSVVKGLGTSDAASEGSISGAGLQARPLYRPAELLETVPGLIVTQHSGEGKANQYFLRGFNLDHGTDLGIFVDGMPVNMRTHGHGQGYADLGFLIPELANRLEFRKGPYFADEGDFSSAGTTRIGLADRLTGQTALATVGANGYRRVLFAGSPADKNLVYGLELLHNDGPWTNPNDLKKLNGVLRFASGSAGNGYSVTAMAYQGKWNATDQIARRAVDSGLINRFDALDPSDGGKSQRYSLSGQWQRSSADQITQANAYVISSKLNLYSNFTYFLNNQTDGDQFEQSDRRTVTGANIAHTWLGKWGGRAVENTVGLQLRQDDIRVGLFNTVERARTSTTRDDKVGESSAGLYVQNRTAWTDKIRSIAGVRADSYRARISSDTAANSGHARDHLVSPKLGMVFGPWAKTEAFANWGRGFHSNDARGTTITVDPASGNATDRVPFLVRSTGQEIGARTVAIPGLVASAALFRLDFDSELLFVGDAGTTEASRPSRRDGFEIDIRYTPLPWLHLDLDYAQTRARFTNSDDAGNRIPGAPERVVSMAATIDTLNNWYGTLQFRYFGQRPLIEDNSVRSGSTPLLSGKIGYKLNKQLRVQLDGFNLAARKASQIDYYYESRLRNEAAGVRDVHFHPVEPRTVRLSVIMNF